MAPNKRKQISSLSQHRLEDNPADDSFLHDSDSAEAGPSASPPLQSSRRGPSLTDISRLLSQLHTTQQQMLATQQQQDKRMDILKHLVQDIHCWHMSQHSDFPPPSP